MSKEFSLRLRYEGGDAEKGLLEAYDGAASIQGFTQALHIAIHGYMKNEVTSRATALKGARVFIEAPRRGSVLIGIVAFIEQYPATLGLAAPVFYDFVKFAFSRACGLFNVEPETPQVIKHFEKEEPFFDELAEQMEGSLQRGHRSIGTTAVTASLERPRSPLIIFNKATKSWVTTRDESPTIEEFTGVVTRYNSVTRNGRAYINEIKKIVPFRPDDAFSTGKDGFLTWSLHGGATNVTNGLLFHGKRIESATGDVKRLILTDCEPKN